MVRGHHFISTFWNNPEALTDDEMKATATLFPPPPPFFPVAFFLSLSQPIFQPFISPSLSKPSSGVQIIRIKKMKRFTASIRGENWLRGAHYIDRMLMWFLCENSNYICFTWLIWWKTAEAHLKCRFFYFPDHSPLTKVQAAVWLEDCWLLCPGIWAVPTQLFG